MLFGAIFALLAVILGAFGAHGLKSQIAEARLESFETGVRYQFYHALGLLLIHLLQEKTSSKLLSMAGWFMVGGVILFSGSIYLLATRDLLGIENVSWLGPITPIGGLLFIVAWIMVVIAALKK